MPAPASAAAPALSSRIIRSGLDYPWDIAFTPGGRMLVTERPGRIRVYGDGTRRARLLSTTFVDAVHAEGESGVMGIAVTRRHGTTFAVVCASRDVDAGWRNQVLRYRLGQAGRLHFEKVILGRMLANTIHNGCAVQIGPDGKVWVTMGDANMLSLPQDRNSRNGKVLRVNLTGSIPRTNPFPHSPVYAMGFRNPQGLAFHPVTGAAYSIEHGPDVNDEINRVRPGRNYGWPCWTGTATPGPAPAGCSAPSEYRTPVWASGSPTLATSNGAFVTGANWQRWRNDLFVSTLKESDVRRFVLTDQGGSAQQRSVLFDGRWGRLRASVPSPSGRGLYLTTSNGGGTDRIIRVRPR